MSGFVRLSPAPPALAKRPPCGLGAKAGGGNRVRTGDPELAKLVLCQLSYAPFYRVGDLRLPYTTEAPTDLVNMTVTTSDQKRNDVP